MPLLTFDAPDSTIGALHELVSITGASGITGLVHDALRTYEWIIDQQANGRIIAVLEEADMERLGSREGDTLVSFIATGQLDAARAYVDRIPAAAGDEMGEG